MSGLSDIKKKTVTVGRLIKLAKDLITEDADNPEYDRALVELIIDAAGLSQNADRASILQELGINPQRPTGA